MKFNEIKLNQIKSNIVKKDVENIQTDPHAHQTLFDSIGRQESMKAFESVHFLRTTCKGQLVRDLPIRSTEILQLDSQQDFAAAPVQHTSASRVDAQRTAAFVKASAAFRCCPFA